MEFRTSKHFLIEQHYDSIAEDLEWTTNRLDRLCAALKLTRAEMAAFIRVRPGNFQRWADENRFPPTVELHLTLIERAAMPVPKPPVFPSL